MAAYKADGVLVRFADDLMVMCRTRAEAERALARLTELLADLGLQPKAAETRVVHLVEGGEGFDFLGFHHRLVRARGRTGARRVVFLARWPSRKAAQHDRDRIRQLSDRSRLLVPVETIVRQVNAFLRGWVGCFHYGNSTRVFDRIRTFALARLALPRQEAQAGAQVGLASGRLHRPQPARPDQPQWSRRRSQALPVQMGNGRTPPVKGVRESCAGEPHARFEAAGAGNGVKNLVMATGVVHPSGKSAALKAPGATTRRNHRASSRRYHKPEGHRLHPIRRLSGIPAAPQSAGAHARRDDHRTTGHLVVLRASRSGRFSSRITCSTA